MLGDECSIGLKGQQLLAQGIALGGAMHGDQRPIGAKAFALSARKFPRQHKNPGRCPGLLAVAPSGRRWVFVIVRADRFATLTHSSGRHRGLPLQLDVDYAGCFFLFFSTN